MQKQTSENGTVRWTGAKADTPFRPEDFSKERVIEGDQMFGLTTDIGRLTVLNSMTGFGWRDIESGFIDTDGKFWLASGGNDVRKSGATTLGEAIAWIKERANANVGV